MDNLSDNIRDYFVKRVNNPMIKCEHRLITVPRKVLNKFAIRHRIINHKFDKIAKKD